MIVFEKVLLPLNVLLFANSVEEAKLQVEVEYEYANPAELTAIPPALNPVREKLPENVLEPLKVLESESKVEDANVQVEVA